MEHAVAARVEGFGKEGKDKFDAFEVDVHFAQHNALLLDPTHIFFKFARKNELMRICRFTNQLTRSLARLLVPVQILDVTCDVSVRVQAAYAVGGLQKLAALFPGKITS